MTAGSPERSSHLYAALIALTALVPYATLWMPFELALRSQAALLLALVLLAAAVSARRDPLARLLGMLRVPAAVGWGLVLYLVAAVWGAGIGLAAGNSLRNIAGQTLSMVLLPLAAVAFLSPRFGGRALVQGLAAAAVGALAVHLAVSFVPAASVAGLRMEDQAGYRLKLVHDVEFVAPGLLLSILALEHWLSERSRLSLLGFVCGALLVVGGMSRGAWISGSIGIGILWAARSFDRRLLKWGVVAVTGLALLAVSLGYWGARQGRAITGLSVPLLEEDPPQGFGAVPGEEHLELRPHTAEGAPAGGALFQRPWDGAAGVEVTARVRGNLSSQAVVWVVGTSNSGEEIVRGIAALPGLGHWRWVRAVFATPEEVDRLTVGITGNGGRWLIERFTLSTYDSQLAVRVRSVGALPVVYRSPDGLRPTGISGWREAILRRVWNVPASLASPGTDATLSYRLREWRAIFDSWSRQPWWRVVIGNGLGATFEFRNVSWNARDERVMEDEANYIHSFYLFLGYKLGVVGLGALASLLLLTGWTWSEARDGTGRGGWTFRAGAAGWIAFLVWSFTSPEILSFRMAPLWGALVAACVMDWRARAR